LTSHILDDPSGLTSNARYFLQTTAVRVATWTGAPYSEQWNRQGIPQTAIDRVTTFQARWGGLALPPAPEYDGGPKYLSADTPERGEDDGWWFEAGDQRTAVPYSFMIDPQGRFGIHANRWVPLHTSIQGWAESIALAYLAARIARNLHKVKGDDIDRLVSQRTRMTPIRVASGPADTWWHGDDGLVAVYRGEAQLFERPDYQIAYVYTDINDLAMWMNRLAED
jgi:hypothetical protein